MSEIDNKRTMCSIYNQLVHLLFNQRPLDCRCVSFLSNRPEYVEFSNSMSSTKIGIRKLSALMLQSSMWKYHSTFGKIDDFDSYSPSLNFWITSWIMFSRTWLFWINLRVCSIPYAVHLFYQPKDLYAHVHLLNATNLTLVNNNTNVNPYT